MLPLPPPPALNDTETCSWQDCSATEKTSGGKLFNCPCKTVYYCCKDHQRLDWKKTHQNICPKKKHRKKKNTTSSYNLQLFQDIDPRTLHDPDTLHNACIKACLFGNVDDVRFLIEQHGADVNGGCTLDQLWAGKTSDGKIMGICACGARTQLEPGKSFSEHCQQRDAVLNYLRSIGARESWNWSPLSVGWDSLWDDRPGSIFGYNGVRIYKYTTCLYNTQVAYVTRIRQLSNDGEIEVADLLLKDGTEIKSQRMDAEECKTIQPTTIDQNWINARIPLPWPMWRLRPTLRSIETIPSDRHRKRVAKVVSKAPMIRIPFGNQYNLSPTTTQWLDCVVEMEDLLYNPWFDDHHQQLLEKAQMPRSTLGSTRYNTEHLICRVIGFEKDGVVTEEKLKQLRAATFCVGNTNWTPCPYQENQDVFARCWQHSVAFARNKYYADDQKAWMLKAACKKRGVNLKGLMDLFPALRQKHSTAALDRARLRVFRPRDPDAEDGTRVYEQFLPQCTLCYKLNYPASFYVLDGKTSSTEKSPPLINITLLNLRMVMPLSKSASTLMQANQSLAIALAPGATMAAVLEVPTIKSSLQDTNMQNSPIQAMLQQLGVAAADVGGDSPDAAREQLRVCHGCGLSAYIKMKRCVCLKVHYCDDVCQKQMRKSHRKDCVVEKTGKKTKQEE